MATLKIAASVAGQLQAGESILAAARTVDTRLVELRVAALEKAQQDYVAAHAKVQEAEANLAAAQVKLGELDADQDTAVDRLARELINEGKSRINPFSGVGSYSPNALMRLPFAEEAEAIRQLVSGLRRAPGIGKASLNAAVTAEEAAQAVERGVAELDALQAAIRNARHSRDAVAQVWATAVGALKRGAAAAADDGGHGLYKALFERPAPAAGTARRRTAAAKSPAQPPPAPSAA